MSLSIQDAVALIYTGSGSQRFIAAKLGISHQKVGRILRTGQEGGYSATSRVLADPTLLSAVAKALKSHTKLAQAVATAHALPFDPRFPVLAQRMEIKEGINAGKLGDRVEAKHTHWLSNELRAAWLKSTRATGKYYAVSAGSIVNLRVYTKRADKEQGRKLRTPQQAQAKKQIAKQIKENTAQGLIQTTYTSFIKGEVPVQYQIAELMEKLETKHLSATGSDMPGTSFASRFLFQVDTRQGKDARFRKTQPLESTSAAAVKAAAPKQRQTRGSARSTAKPRAKK